VKEEEADLEDALFVTAMFRPAAEAAWQPSSQASSQAPSQTPPPLPPSSRTSTGSPAPAWRGTQIQANETTRSAAGGDELQNLRGFLERSFSDMCNSMAERLTAAVTERSRVVMDKLESQIQKVTPPSHLENIAQMDQIS
jgi:hypothetical protein